jgi:O-6-methylguanine DNA methyltransferase
MADRFHFEATERGICRLAYGRGRDVATGRGRRHVEQARAELTEYLAGRRTFFTVPVDLTGVAGFQGRVLAETRRIPFGVVSSYAALARRIGHPRAARAVGNALGANPVPMLVPCHRVIRVDGTWGRYAFGGTMKTRLLVLERITPLLVASTSTRIVCRRGCRNERRIVERRRVVFASVADATGLGYRPCRACRPRDETA